MIVYFAINWSAGGKNCILYEFMANKIITTFIHKIVNIVFLYGT